MVIIRAGCRSGVKTVERGEDERFVQLCLRGRIHPAALDEARELATGMNWQRVTRIAQTTGVQPLLYWTLHGHGILPEPVEAAFGQAYLWTARQNGLAFRELAAAISRLAAAGVPAMVLKGVALIESVYGGNLGVRPMVDVDLLVRRSDAATALPLLIEMGYATMAPEVRPGLTLEFENEVMLRNSGRSGRSFELHWGLLNSMHHERQVSEKWLWDTSLPITLAGRSVQSLGPEAQVVYLCSHLVLHHQSEGLVWLHDIAEVLAASERLINWEELVTRARLYDLLLPLQSVLPTIVEGWGAPVPPGVLTQLAASQPSAAERSVFAALTAEDRPVGQRFLSDLAGLSGWRRRAVYAIGNLFPSRQYMMARYAIARPVLLPLYYLYRWWLGLRSTLPHRQT